MKQTTLARALREFLTDHLPRLRGTSRHTVQSYRDSFKLLLRFLSSGRRDITTLDIDDIQPEGVIRFLQFLEDERHNTVSSRNVRLSAIHSFFRYVATSCPERIQHCQRILCIPFKRARNRTVEYLEYEELEAVLTTVDRQVFDGRRDYALLATMFNTGARVQEVLDLKPCDLQLEKPYYVRLFGKGRKERVCALWPQTAAVLKAFLSEQRIDTTSRAPLFRNHCGGHLTRFGVRYILAKYCNRAKITKPSLGTKRLHPHSMRHSTAVYMLQSGADPITISQLLGHASVNTTNRYATVNLEMKRKAIEKATAIQQKKRSSSWKKNPSILEWLESL